MSSVLGIRLRAWARLAALGAICLLLFLVWFFQPDDPIILDPEPPGFPKDLRIRELETLQVDLKEQPKFTASSKNAFAAIVYSDDYTISTLILGHSLKKHNPGYDLVAGYVEDLVTEPTKCMLRLGGWKLRPIKRIEPPQTEHNKPPKHFHHMFAKLRVWTWTEYSKVLYLDSDTLCVGPMSDIFDNNLNFSAALDIYPWELDIKMNMGVMLVRPDIEEFKRLVYDSHRYKYKYTLEASEQSYLYFETHSDVFNLPYMYNTNLAFYGHERFWKQMLNESRLIHYTYPKPFRQNRHSILGLRNRDLALAWYEDYDEFMNTKRLEVLKCGGASVRATRL